MTDTRERAAARKRAQRERDKANGKRSVTITVDEQEWQMLLQNCAARRPGREPYDAEEYLQLLIRQDSKAVQALLTELAGSKCEKCGEGLPVAECCMTGDSECWCTSGWHFTKLKL